MRYVICVFIVMPHRKRYAWYRTIREMSLGFVIWKAQLLNIPLLYKYTWKYHSISKVDVCKIDSEFQNVISHKGIRIHQFSHQSILPTQSSNRIDTILLTINNISTCNKFDCEEGENYNTHYWSYQWYP